MNGTSQGLGLLLHDASRALRKRFEARSLSLGLSSAQWRLLLLVCREPGVPQSRFADRLDIEPISVSRLVDRMVAGGWLVRAEDARDRRVKLICPTDKALAAHQSIKAIADEVYAEALAGLTEAEAQTLMRGLTAICTNLAAGDPAATAHDLRGADASAEYQD